MKRIALITVIFLATQIAISQVVVLNYMRVPANGGERYEAVEKEILKVQQERVNRGEMSAWELYKVYNTGSESPYHYVTADIYPDLASSMNGISWEVVRNVLGDDAERVVDEVMDSRELTYREVIGFAMGFFAEGDEKFLVVNYMKADDPGKYFEMEYNAFMPLHKLAKEKGNMVSWNVWTPILFDERSNYTAIAVDGYASTDQIGTTDYAGLIKAFSEGKSDKEMASFNEMLDHVQTTRTRVRSQVWEKLLFTAPAE